MSELFGPMFSSEPMRDAVSDRSWLQAMLDVEAALARALERTGIAPPGTANVIQPRCTADAFDIAAIGRGSTAGANPVIPLVEALRAAVPAPARDWVHHGATSQDILDSAAMRITRRALDLLIIDVTVAGDACAQLATRHGDSVMAARTLMQQAVPTTFGLKAADWLMGLLEARQSLSDVRTARLAAQLGGAAGTLAAYGHNAAAMMEAFATELELPEPVLPWHTNRARIGEIAVSVANAANACARIATSIVLLMQSEVGEVSEGAAPGRGRSSAMPGKRNPSGSVAIIASARQCLGFATVLLAAGVQEHERAAGAWQSEWAALSGLLLNASGATAGVAALLPELEVHPVRMRANLVPALGVDTGASDLLIARALAAWRADQGRP